MGDLVETGLLYAVDLVAVLIGSSAELERAGAASAAGNGQHHHVAVKLDHGLDVVVVVELGGASLQVGQLGQRQTSGDALLEIADRREVQVQPLAVGLRKVAAGQQARQLAPDQIVHALAAQLKLCQLGRRNLTQAEDVLIGSEWTALRCAELARSPVRQHFVEVAGLDAGIQRERLFAGVAELRGDAVVERLAERE